MHWEPQFTVFSGRLSFLPERVDEYAWQEIRMDLTEYAGNSIELELWNQAVDWMSWRCEAAYWSRIAIASK